MTPPPAKPEATDPAEVAPVLERHGKGAEPNPAEGSPKLPCQGPRGGDLVTVGGATFVMDSGSDMTLRPRCDPMMPGGAHGRGATGMHAGKTEAFEENIT